MTNFSIELSENEFESEGNIVSLGSLTIGDFSENFQASLSYWNRENYLSQWRESLSRLLSGECNSAFVTTMYNPDTTNFIFWWVMYLIGENVHIQNHVLFFDELEQSFDESDIYKFIPIRETHSEEGEPISEWVLNIDDIKKCFDSLRK